MSITRIKISMTMMPQWHYFKKMQDPDVDIGCDTIFSFRFCTDTIFYDPAAQHGPVMSGAY